LFNKFAPTNQRNTKVAFEGSAEGSEKPMKFGRITPEKHQNVGKQLIVNLCRELT